jgi:hypothetical protein
VSAVRELDVQLDQLSAWMANRHRGSFTLCGLAQERPRYVVEFRAATFAPPAQRFVHRVVELQDRLGSHQWACVADQHAADDGHPREFALPAEVVFVMASSRSATPTRRLNCNGSSGKASDRRWQALGEAPPRSAPIPQPTGPRLAANWRGGQ